MPSSSRNGSPVSWASGCSRSCRRSPPDAPGRSRTVARRAGPVRGRSTVGQALGDDVVPLLRQHPPRLGECRHGRGDRRGTVPADRGDARPRLGPTGTRLLLGGARPRRRAAGRCTGCTRAARPWPWHRSRARSRSWWKLRPTRRSRSSGPRRSVRSTPPATLSSTPWRRADVVLVDVAAEALLYDLALLDEVMRTRPARDQQRARTRRVLDACPRRARQPAPRRPRPGRLLAPELARPAAARLAPHRRHRARPHRHRVAVADAGDGTQVRPHVLVGGAAARRRPSAPLRRFAGPAVRVGPPARAGAVRPDQAEGGGRPVDPGRRAVGGGRHEPAVGREPGPTDRARPALLRGALRRALHRDVDPRRVRLPRRAPSAVPRRRHGALRHPEAVVEPHEPLPPPHVLVGRARRVTRADPLPARRHVQRRDASA